MSEIEKTIKLTRKIESLLEDKLAANGRGLHEKISAVEHRLSPSLTSELRKIATIRNKLVHEDDFQIENSTNFFNYCEEVINYLQSQPNQNCSIISKAEIDKIVRESFTFFLVGFFYYAILVIDILVSFFSTKFTGLFLYNYHKAKNHLPDYAIIDVISGLIIGGIVIVPYLIISYKIRRNRDIIYMKNNLHLSDLLLQKYAPVVLISTFACLVFFSIYQDFF